MILSVFCVDDEMVVGLKGGEAKLRRPYIYSRGEKASTDYIHISVEFYSTV